MRQCRDRILIVAVDQLLTAKLGGIGDSIDGLDDRVHLELIGLELVGLIAPVLAA